MSNSTFTLDEVRAAFWTTFHRQGDIWFRHSGSDAECEQHTEDVWGDFRDALLAQEAPQAALDAAITPAEVTQACRVARREAYELVKELAEALRDMFALMDEGLLVRSIADDAKPDYSMRMLGFVRRLGKAHAALAKVFEQP